MLKTIGILMKKEKTLLLIKPDSIKKNIIGKIITSIEKKNIEINNIIMLKFNTNEAEIFYSDHKEKPFFKELVSFITSGKIIALILTGDNVIKKTRTLIGDTNFKNAKKNTIRAKFATNLTENAVHSSDSQKSYEKEIKIILEINKKNEHE